MKYILFDELGYELDRGSLKRVQKACDQNPGSHIVRENDPIIAEFTHNITKESSPEAEHFCIDCGRLTEHPHHHN